MKFAVVVEIDTEALAKAMHSPLWEQCSDDVITTEAIQAALEKALAQVPPKVKRAPAE